MSDLQRTLADLANKLSELRIPYMLIGGMANAIWGEPRATLDIDVTIQVDESRKDSVIDALCRCYDVLVASPLEFVGMTIPFKVVENRHKINCRLGKGRQAVPNVRADSLGTLRFAQPT